jgi:hypothetical protein
MDDSPNFSDLKLERKECPKCHAIWINGEHRWSGTGNVGSEKDLAGLVCNTVGDEQCINPKKGYVGGDTWEYRAGYIDGAIKGRKDTLGELNKQLGDD